MKHLSLAFVGFLFTANLFAQAAPQKADTVFTYEWKSEGWELTLVKGILQNIYLCMRFEALTEKLNNIG